MKQVQGLRRCKEIPIGLFFLKYFLYIFAGILLIVFLLAGAFVALLSSDFVYPARYAEEQAQLAVETIQAAERVSEEMIPELCRYTVFDKEGQILAGNMKEKDTMRAWDVLTGRKYNGGAYVGAYYYLTIPRDEECCVLQYQIVVQYRSALLRKYLPLPELMLLIIFLVLVFTVILSVAVRFNCVIRRKLSPLADVADRIQRQELDFNIVYGSIREINAVLNAMDDMRAALKESLEKQWRMEQIKKEQMSALAHDLKTPLTLVRGNAELLSDTPLSDEQKEYVSGIVDSALQMQDYVQRMIEIIRNVTSLPINRREINIGTFLDKIQRQVSGLCTVHQIHLRWKDAVLTQEIYAEETFLSRAFLNLFANAVEHTPPGGTVTFEAREDEKNFVFTVSDTGKGFTESALRHAKEQFYMDDASRNAAGSHYGMGLYIVDTIVKQHNGVLLLENMQSVPADGLENGKCVGTGGARVTVKIPIV
ncbi:MAG: HAMP domain-containing histidine kinase [Eubacterium sp.]|nr:HAMP domain-containing histidine kinase [Eubacterium sp.]